MALTDKKSVSKTDITVYDFFAEVLADQADLLTGDPSDVVDNTIKDFAANLASSDMTEDVILVPHEKNSYTLSFRFEEFGKVLEALAGAGLEQTVIRETDSSLEFYLDLDNYGDLEKAIPFLADPNFEVYGPRYNQGTSVEDYLDMMYYFLGEEAPDAIMESMITVEIKVPGNIKTYEGCEKTGARSVRYELPLIDFLILPEPLTFRVTW